MKSLIRLLVVLALLAAIGIGVYIVFLRPKPVVWRTEMGVVPVPHCPYCDASLLALDEVCPKCGRAVLWEGKEKLKDDMARLREKAGEALDQAKEGAKEAGAKLQKQVDTLREE